MSARETDTAPEALVALRGARPAPAVENRIVEGALARAMGPRPRPVWPWLVAGAAAAAAVFFGLSRPPAVPEGAESVVALETSDPPAAPPTTPPPAAEGVRYVAEGADAVYRVETPGINQKVVHLSAGTATFEVAPVPAGGLFAVQTPHGRVEVVGTRFTVAVGARCSRVSVSEGRVRVRRDHEAFLVPAGESREVCRGGEAGEGLMGRAQEDLAAGRLDDARRGFEAYLELAPGGLFAEDALFHLALLARRSGDVAARREATERFLARFPTGPRVERLRSPGP